MESAIQKFEDLKIKSDEKISEKKRAIDELDFKVIIISRTGFIEPCS